jgi:tetratricopeptide (TPR) repeat protein
LSVPQVFLFYFRQMGFPIVLAENYPLRPVERIGLVDFVLPLVVSVFIAAAVWLAARGSRLRIIGALILLLPLLPVLNITAFPSDQIVHDRYLYFPLFGLLIVVFSLLDELLRQRLPERAAAALVIAAVVVAVPLAAQTYLYNRTWSSNIALWSHNAKIDPSSPSTLVNYGAELSGLGRYDEAISAFDRSLQIRPNAGAYMARARNLMAVRRIADAESDLLTVVAMPPGTLNAYTLYQSYEALALLYTQTGDVAKAEDRLREARGRLPIYSAALSEKLAVVLYQKGDKQAALAELEAARGQARKELLPESKAVFLRLGMLYAELGKKPEARNALQEYLNLTAGLADGTTMSDRARAANLLRAVQ